MGLKVVLSDVSFTDTSLPILYPDPIMSSGSLLLIDLSHPDGYDGGTTLPVNGTMIPNIAWETLADVLGSGTRTSLSPTFRVSGLTGSSSSKHLLEFTSRKGLHGIISQSPGVSAGNWMGINGLEALRTYMVANAPTNQFFVSMWTRTTRVQAAGSAPQAMHYVATNTVAGNRVYYVDPGSLATNGTAVGQRNANANTLANLIRNFANPAAAVTSATAMKTWVWGSEGAWAGFNTTQCRSDILYKLYIEDLTVSGRTYAEVDALDYALWQEAFASGGRFYDDSFTNPSTVP